MNIKKFTGLALAMALSLGLTACGNNKPADEGKDEKRQKMPLRLMKVRKKAKKKRNLMEKLKKLLFFSTMDLIHISHLFVNN